jgi:hypothetical protein
VTDERRAPVQGDSTHWLAKGHPRREPNAHPPGTVAWWEHVEAWEVYHKLYGNDQSAERMAERSGFGYLEMTDLLGHEPTTWKPV